MHLSRTQVRSLGPPSVEQFVARALLQVRQDWPDEVALMGPRRTDDAVRMTVQRALQLGLDTEYDIGRLLLLVFAHRSLRFLDEPWARRHLDAHLPARERMNRLFDAALAALPD